jgi:hypothetical protein
MRKIQKQVPPEDLARFVRRERPQKFEEIHHSELFPELYDEVHRAVEDRAGKPERIYRKAFEKRCPCGPFPKAGFV